jgi:DNA modification methylase
MRPQLSSPGTLERGAGTVYRGTDPPNFKPAPETAAFEPRVSPPKKPETYPMARTTHDPVLTADARSARIADAPIEGAATQTGAGLLDRSCAAHIAPQLRALVVPLDSVTLHPRNPRQGDVAAVAASLRRFGQLKPVVVQASTRYVVAGNHLVRAARSLGWTEIAANVEELDDAEATAFMLADNRTSDLGGYDDALLAAILAEQEAADNLAATGYDDDDVAALLRAAGIEASHGDPDAAPDRPADADVYVRPGELWALGRHRLLVDDSTDPAAVERVTAGTSVDMVWCDPPYSVGVVGRTAAALTIVNDNLDAAGTRALIGTALGLAPLRPGGAFYVASPAGPAHLAFLLALADASLPVHQTIIWAKDRFVLGHSDYHYRHEPVLYGWRDGAAHHFIDDRTQDSVWEIPRPTRSEVHPTMKPVELVERAIRNSSRPGDTVYDGFVGSGTTLIAAEKSMRACRALEIDPTYAQVAIERWQAFTGQSAERMA